MGSVSSSQQAIVHDWVNLPQDFPIKGVARKRIIGSQAMLSQVTLRQGAIVPMHAHANEQFACILTGRLRFEIEDAPGHPPRIVTASAGQVLYLPANVPHAAFAEIDTDVLDIFSPPSEKTGVDRA